MEWMSRVKMPYGMSEGSFLNRAKLFAALVASLFLHATIAHCFIFFAIFVLSKGVWIPLSTSWGPDGYPWWLPYYSQIPRVSERVSYDAYVLGIRDVQQLVGNWGVVLVAALCSILLLQLRRGGWPKPQVEWLARSRHTVARLLQYQLYPRRFWIWWCGGLSVADLLLVATWWAYNLYWVLSKAWHRSGIVNDAIEAGTMSVREGRLAMLKQVGASIGAVSMFQMAMLFFPVPRNTFLHHVFRTDFSGLLKYHRWLGFALAYTILIHGAMFYVHWALIEDRFSASFWKWGHDKANNLAGSIAAAFCLMLLATSMQWVRRMYFQVFIRCHTIGFVGFTAFAYIHFWQRWIYQTPGLLLLCLDWSFRLSQWLRPSHVTGHLTQGSKSLVTLVFTWKKGTNPRPGQYMFLNAPTLGAGSRLDWHPVTITHVNATAPHHTTVTAHMKCYGRWTRAVAAKIATHGGLLMRVEGPYGKVASWQEYDLIVIVAGGIGATPMLGMVREMAQERRRAAAEGEEAGAKLLGSFPSRVELHWSCRGGSEFALLDAELIDLHMEEGGWLDIHLYSTPEWGQGARADAVAADDRARLLDGAPSAEVELRKLDIPEGGPLVCEALPSDSAPCCQLPADRSLSSFRLPPGPLEPYVGGLGWWMVCHVLAFVGAFFALLLAQTYNTDLRLTGQNARQNWRTGVLILIASFLGSMGLPALAIFARRFASLERERRSEQEAIATNDGLQEGVSAPLGLDSVPLRPLVGTAEEGAQLLVQPSRPDIPAILQQAATENVNARSIAVFASGPGSMLSAVKLECAEHNARWKLPYLDFSNHAYEL